MTTLKVYDVDAELIEDIAIKSDLSEATVLEAILIALEDNDIDINDYL